MVSILMQICPVDPVALWKESSAEDAALVAVALLDLLCKEPLEGNLCIGALVGAGGKPAEGGGVGRWERPGANECTAVSFAGGFALKRGSISVSG